MEDIHGGGCKEFRVFGPPGTGKTTWLVKQVRRAAEKRRRRKWSTASRRRMRSP